jgi:hypothetical protein
MGNNSQDWMDPGHYWILGIVEAEDRGLVASGSKHRGHILDGCDTDVTVPSARVTSPSQANEIEIATSDFAISSTAK